MALATGCATFAALLGWIAGVIGMTWAPWSQTDILLNKVAGYPEFATECPNCHMVNKLTAYRAPGYWCLALRQKVYLPDAPPPPPPNWRRLDEDPYNIEPDHADLKKTDEKTYGVDFKYEEWTNVTCAPDAWYFDNCVRDDTGVPDGCGAADDNVTWVKENVVPVECTPEKYADKYIPKLGPWGDCYFPSDDTSRIDGADYCYPAGSTNAAGEVCSCKCGSRCQDKLDECVEAYTAEARYQQAICKAKRQSCTGTASTYGAAVAGLFFSSIALIPYMAAGYIKDPYMARATLQLGFGLTVLALLLYVGALGWWQSYVHMMNEPRQIYLETMNRVDLFNFDLYHPVRPNFFVEHLEPNPMTWERYLKAPAFLQLKEQFTWNWGWNFLSGGFYTIIVAIALQCFGLIFASWALKEKRAYDLPPEKAAASDV